MWQAQRGSFGAFLASGLFLNAPARTSVDRTYHHRNDRTGIPAHSAFAMYRVFQTFILSQLQVMTSVQRCTSLRFACTRHTCSNRSTMERYKAKRSNRVVLVPIEPSSFLRTNGSLLCTPPAWPRVLIEIVGTATSLWEEREFDFCRNAARGHALR